MPVESQWIVNGEGFVNLHVVAKPASARCGILRRDSRGLVIALNSRAARGKANDELIEFLADLLGTPRSSVSITHGHTCRLKTVRIVHPQPLRVTSLMSFYR